MSGFGECQSCGCSVERVGWDDLCFACQESEKAEASDDEEERATCAEQPGRPFRGLRRPSAPAEDGGSHRKEQTSSDASPQ